MQSRRSEERTTPLDCHSNQGGGVSAQALNVPTRRVDRRSVSRKALNHEDPREPVDADERPRSRRNAAPPRSRIHSSVILRSTQNIEKAYPGAWTSSDTSVEVGAGAWSSWNPSMDEALADRCCGGSALWV